MLDKVLADDFTKTAYLAISKEISKRRNGNLEGKLLTVEPKDSKPRKPYLCKCPSITDLLESTLQPKQDYLHFTSFVGTHVRSRRKQDNNRIILEGHHICLPFREIFDCYIQRSKNYRDKPNTYLTFYVLKGNNIGKTTRETHTIHIFIYDH